MGAASRNLLSQRWPCWLLVLILACEVNLTTARAVDKVPRQAVNTQDPADIPPTPAEALAKITVPDGFQVSLFAGEPDVHQPLAFCFDDRGRLWVVENYSHPKWHKENATDRILVLELEEGAWSGVAGRVEKAGEGREDGAYWGIRSAGDNGGVEYENAQEAACTEDGQ